MLLLEDVAKHKTITKKISGVPVQILSIPSLIKMKKASPTQIAKFLDDFRKLKTQSPQPKERDPSKLISLRLPLRILLRLKARAKAEQIPYQTLLKKILEDNLP
jgi:predicted DNA binding CopG/RHH family protein